VRERGITGGLTGAIRRGDRDTVARHLQSLAAQPELAEMYRVLGRRVVSLARSIGDVPDERLDEIQQLLSTASDDVSASRATP
jgi:predicted short-subunit dehydrogenase-like oxidoreductase (DUF2520 family)